MPPCSEPLKIIFFSRNACKWGPFGFVFRVFEANFLHRPKNDVEPNNTRFFKLGAETADFQKIQLCLELVERCGKEGKIFKNFLSLFGS